MTFIIQFYFDDYCPFGVLFLSEQRLLLKSSGNGNNLIRENMLSSLFQGLFINNNPGLTKNDTSAMATYKRNPPGLFSEVSFSI